MKGFFESSVLQTPKALDSMSPKCGRCGLYKTCRHPKMKPFGDGRRKVLVVGEAPGQTEDDRGRPFIGKAGQHLRQCLRLIGIDLDRDAWTTNALICRPPGNASPDDNRIHWCRPNLAETLRLLEPAVVVPLGRTALVSLLYSLWPSDVGVLERWIGWQIRGPGYWLCPTYHPSYLLRTHNELMNREFVEHLEAAFDIEARPKPRTDPKGKVELLYDDREAAQAIDDIEAQGGWAAADYEGNCLKPEYPKGRIYSCAISNGRRTISYPWVGQAIEATGRFWQSKQVRKIASNLKFEERWTRHLFGQGAVNWGWDTMLAAHCLDNRPGICSLKFQAFVHLGEAPYNEAIAPYLASPRGHYNRIEEIPLADLLLYGGLDALFEYRLARFQRKEMGYEDDFA